LFHIGPPVIPATSVISTEGRNLIFHCKSHAQNSYLLCKPIGDQEMAAKKETILLSSANPDWKVLSDE
jgi:hypothetical protein